jgi:hypothetical protein
MEKTTELRIFEKLDKIETTVTEIKTELFGMQGNNGLKGRIVKLEEKELPCIELKEHLLEHKNKPKKKRTDVTWVLGIILFCYATVDLTFFILSKVGII